jgi:phage terminase Nu1 subunit (DNA packaging protein)
MKFSLSDLRKATVDVGTLAELLGRTPRRVQQLADEGIIEKADHGEYNLLFQGPGGNGSSQGVKDVARGEYKLAESIRNFVEYLKKGDGGEEASTLAGERARLTKHQADMAEMESKEKEGTLINVETAMRMWGERIAGARSNLLAIPTKVSPVVLACKTMVEAKETLQRYIWEVLEDLAKPVELHSSKKKVPRRPQRDLEVVQAAVDNDGERVG